MKQPRTFKERNLGWELFEELSWEGLLPKNVSDMVYTIKHLLPVQSGAYMYSSLVSVLTAKPWPSASKVIAVPGGIWGFDWHFSTVAVCVGVCQHKQLQRQCDSAIVCNTGSAGQGLHVYTVISFKMSLCLGNVPFLPRLSTQADASVLDNKRDPGFFRPEGKIKQHRSPAARNQREYRYSFGHLQKRHKI